MSDLFEDYRCYVILYFDMAPVSIYLHIPFCRHRCNYCDFNTYAGHEKQIPAYLRALRHEIAFLGKSAGSRLPAHTVFFGGGTPSLVPPDEIRLVLEQIAKRFDLLPEAEITMEANPGTVSKSQLSALRAAGVNRLSFGMQSSHPEELRLLERIHSFTDVIDAVRWSRQAGFDNLSLDLIFGLPFQSLARWKDTLECALALRTEHLSLYALTVEPGTRLHTWVRRGIVPAPDEDEAAEMYEYAMERLERDGLRQYEISNWARSSESGVDYASRHNVQYWSDLPYLGLGAGAHGYAAGVRTANVDGIGQYIRRMENENDLAFPLSPANKVSEAIDRSTEMQEWMMVGLRLTEQGVSRAVFCERFNQELGTVFGHEISELTRVGLLEWVGERQDRLRLTRKGRLLGNQVFMRFVGN